MKCIGCGVELQSIDINKDGYTPKIDNKLCQRCFKIKNYGENITNVEPINNEKIIAKINKQKGFVIFLIDFLNIYEEVITTYKKISLPKMLVITKSDLIPKNIKRDILVTNIKNYYQIDEEILFTSSKNKENINVLKDIILTKEKVFFMGFTNSGKSSLINKLADTNLTISKRANTTLDFIKIKIDGSYIYDSPGFLASTFYDGLVPKNLIRPVTYQLKNKYYLKINDINVASNIDNNLTFFTSNELKIAKRKLSEDIKYEYEIEDNSDFIIKGLGFILIKKKCILSCSANPNLIEIRKSLVGGKNE